MSYQNQFSRYDVKIGFNTMAWFKDYNKAVAKYNFYAAAPDELDDTLMLVNHKTGKVLKQCEPED